MRARKLPAIGGVTIFADTAAIYPDLPPDIKARIETLDAEPTRVCPVFFDSKKRDKQTLNQTPRRATWF